MKNILLIEDNTAIRENATELLELEGYRVISASNGKHGLQMAIDLLPDIILSDIVMPEMNGYEVFKEVRGNTATSHIPFIFLTSIAEKKDVTAALEQGVNGYIQKPFEANELFLTIKRCLK